MQRSRFRDWLSPSFYERLKCGSGHDDLHQAIMELLSSDALFTESEAENAVRFRVKKRLVDSKRRSSRISFVSLDAANCPHPAAPSIYSIESRRLVRDAVSALPADLREIIEAHHLRLEPVPTIANRLKLPQPTVYDRLRRGRIALAIDPRITALWN